MRRILFLAAVLAALLAPSIGRAATEIAIVSPAAGSHSLQGIVPVTINASATAGVYSVQLKVDGVAVGEPDITPTAPYTYVIDWNTAGLLYGNHTLTATALDWSLPLGGPATDSAPVVVDVGPAYPTVTLDAPAAWSFVRGTAQLAASATSAIDPLRVQFYADGKLLSSSSAAPWTAQWNTGADGSHVVSVQATDGRGKSATASSTVTVDNTRPLASITSPGQWTYVTSSIAVQANASDGYGIESVQFLLDGAPVGTAHTQPDPGTSYTYSDTLPVTGATGSQHRVAIRALDHAGNSTTSASVYFTLSAAPVSAKVTAPVEGSFVRAVTPVTAAPQGGTPPYSLRLIVDSKATKQYVSASPYTIQWDTRPLTAGVHTVQMNVTDSTGKSSTSAAVHVTVDNTAPSVAMTSPVAGASFGTSVPASATASDAYGVATVQFALDGVRTGPVLTAPDVAGSYSYSASLPLAGVTTGTHALTVLATDPAGNTATSAPVYFLVGTGTTPQAKITLPPDWSFGQGVTPVAVSVTGGTAPMTVRLVIDNKATTLQTAVSPYVISWDTRAYSDGSHTLQASVTDAAARGSTSPAIHVTVDNTAPSVVVLSPTADQRVSTSSISLQVHASDAYGVRSVQFAVDGGNVGPLLTAADSGVPYVYSFPFDTTTVAAGLHNVTATVIDNAGNTTTTAPVSMKTGPLEYLPVLNYHQIAPPDGYSLTDQTPAEADAQLAYLKANGYQSVTLDQYRQWLAGANIGVAKPVLITVDDGLKSELAWDALLEKYGFHAVLFVVTGYADGTTPGGQDPNNMTWADIQGLAATGRWEIGLHAGQYGHGDSYGTGTPIGAQSYTSTCPYFYSCLSRSRVRLTWVTESVAAFQTAVSNEITAGRAELLQKVPAAVVTAWAAPFNDAGQWTNLYNDASGQVQAWLPGYLASQFSLVFTQTSPVTYGQASGLVGSLTGFNRHYRFEVHTDTTIEQFAANLVDPAFLR